MFKYLVLGLLRSGECRHGYAMMKEYRERAGVSVSTGNFYRELARLVVEGLVEPASNPPGNDPRRTPYRITDDGIGAFDAWFREPLGATIAAHDDGVSARAVFLVEAGPEVAIAALARWREELWIQSKTVEHAREAALRLSAQDRGRKFAGLAVLLARRLKHIAADLDFLEEFRIAYERWVAATGPGSYAATVARRRELEKGSGPI